MKIFLEHLVFAVFMSIPADRTGSFKGHTGTSVSAECVPVYQCSSVVQIQIRIGQLWVN